MSMLAESIPKSSAPPIPAPGPELCQAADAFLARIAMAYSSDSILIADAGGIIRYVNAVFEDMSGYAARELVGRPASIFKSVQHSRDFYTGMRSALAAGRSFRAIFTNRTKSGVLFHEEKTIRPVIGPNGQITHFISIGRSVDARFEADRELSWSAHRDALTALPNRNWFVRCLDDYLSQCNGARGLVLMLDINNLKRINDTLGHEAGDHALREVAARLTAFCSEAESSPCPTANAARTGGDEFTLAVADSANALAPRAVAERILDMLGRPLQLGGQEVFLSASIGIAKFPEDAGAAEDLVRHADLALHRAKDAGRNLYRFYHESMRSRLHEDLQIESALHGALERGELDLAFQPIVRASDRELICVEALLRWHSPVVGTVEPTRFIPQLEKNGLIVPVGLWVLAGACAAVRPLRNGEGTPLRVAVNISARQLLHPGFMSDVKSALDTSGLDPHRLELEITESVLIENAAAAAEVLRELRRLGVRMAADDFGTGYSSLSYLWKFPFHTLKIDRSFIEEMRHDPQVRVIVASILNLAHGLGLDVVAEGVETASQRDMLNDAGCALIQGYWSGRPLSAKSINAHTLASYCIRPEAERTA